MKLTPDGVVFSFLQHQHQSVEEQANPMNQWAVIAGLKAV